MTQLFLLARIAGRAVAIEADHVVSVVDLPPLIPVPRAAGHVRGLAALRSRVVTVIDPAVALHVERRAEQATRAVLTRVDGHDYALIVDAVEDVVPFELEPLSAGLPLDPFWQDAAVGLVVRDGVPVLALNIVRLVPDVLPPATIAA